MTYQNRIKVDFLNIEKNGVYLIGYPIKLSPSERALLYEIAAKNGASIDDLLSLLAEGVSRGNVAVAINGVTSPQVQSSSRRWVAARHSHSPAH